MSDLTVRATNPPSMGVRVGDVELMVTPSHPAMHRIDLVAKRGGDVIVLLGALTQFEHPQRPVLPAGCEFLAYVHVHRASAAIMNGNIETGMVAWLTACYDRAEQRAKATARAVGEMHYALVEAPQYDDTSGRWTARRWLYVKKVSAEDGRSWWRDEGPKVTDGVWPEVADHIADHDPSWRLADIARKRLILARCVAEFPGEPGDFRGWVRNFAETAIRMLAEEFVDEPGYLPDWHLGA